MLTKLRKAQRLSADERWLLAQAFVLLPLTFCGIYVLGVSRWQRVLMKLARVSSASIRYRDLDSKASTEIMPCAETRSIEQARAIARIVYIAAHHGVYRANCLQQTLVLWSLLRRDGIESEIRFGARKEDGQLQAHAWVEYLGVVLNEESDVCRHFSPFEGVAVGASTEGSDVVTARTGNPICL
ncbi:MAG TPA: lasso peptide biosynthesis B2 protein [Pyrinomonadaceae bacterium]|nr:lasso peptide biosynthesis B2 protein [Pyrinomonadaceae bacterium]